MFSETIFLYIFFNTYVYQVHLYSHITSYICHFYSAIDKSAGLIVSYNKAIGTFLFDENKNKMLGMYR